VAIVPVGLTRHRERLPALRTLHEGEARALVDTVERWQQRFVERLGSRLVFLADEVYLQAGRPLPPAGAYEGFPVAEDGIGLVRRFEDELDRAAGRWQPPRAPRTVTVASGTMYAGRLAALLGRLAAPTLRARVVAVPNDLFGGNVGVAGLLAGRDIARRLGREARLGDEVLVPAVCIRDGDGVFLDDLTPADLARELGVRVRVVEPGGRALLAALRGA
jgi:NifB/MoaA-like Fe-S oxidoreductase